jgi:hypothetical protein
MLAWHRRVTLPHRYRWNARRMDRLPRLSGFDAVKASGLPIPHAPRDRE